MEAWVHPHELLWALLRILKKEKHILILGFGLTQGLYDNTPTAEAQYSINFSRSNKTFGLRLYYNGSESFLYVNSTKLYQFKAKNSEIKKIFLVFRKYFQEMFQLITWKNQN